MRGIAAAVCALLLAAASRTQAAEPLGYQLVPRSTVLQHCASCPEPAGRPEALVGSFYLTPVNLAEGTHIEAVTDVRWESRSYKISGSGFVQFDAQGRLQVELRARINGEEMRLRSTRRQAPRTGFFNVVLATERDAPVGYLIVLTARAEGAPVADSDLDGVGDSQDNCRAQSNSEQADRDFDSVGDTCDQCPDTGTRAMVTPDGCSVEQLCPCESTRLGQVWRRGGYAKCVARALRDLRRLGLLSRSDAALTLRRSLRSGCGQTVIASLAAAVPKPCT